MTSSLIIVYHANCIDGAASAWAVAKAHKAEETAIYLPYEHFNHPAAEKKIRAAANPDAEIYFVDVAPEKDFLDELLASAVKSIHILDHHKSAAEALKNYPPSSRLEIHIDPARHSAAKMVWERLLTENPPDVLNVIDKMDGDATGLKTPQDFAAAALIDTHDVRTITGALDALRGLAKLSFNEMAAHGAPTLTDQENRIENLLDNTQFATLQILPGAAPVSVPVVNGNVQHFGRYISDRLVSLGKEHGANIAFAWSMQKNGSITMSLRTDGNPDCSAVARHLCETLGVTGGGHAGAGAVHFASLAEFTRRMPMTAKPVTKPAGPSI